MTKAEQDLAAKAFREEWTGKGYEKGETQKFWIELLNSVFGVKDYAQRIFFEDQVKLGHKSFIDARIPSTKVLIEQKSSNKDLRTPILQSDGSMLTPFEQAKRYADELPFSERPRWIVTCNFSEWLIYDMEHPHEEPQQVLLENIEKEYERLRFLVDASNKHVQKEVEISVKAGQLIGKIYDLLQKQYIEPDSPETLRYLNIICVRLVFCLYSEDAGVFAHRQQFGDYLRKHMQANGDIRKALKELFEVFDTKLEDRDPYMDEDLAAFPYVSGGLFTDHSVEIPRFTKELTDLLIENTSEDIDWSGISPTIFGAVFESTLNPETRRTGGMHYTSVQNIHKVIDPLFLDDLYAEFESISVGTLDKKMRTKLEAFQQKLASLRFFDPACGSGNFLTETYLSLRRLENLVIRKLLGDQAIIGEFSDPIRVKIDQFYGIEINDFAVTVAQTALWIAEAQMMLETEKIVMQNIDFLPLKSYAHVVEGNALRTDWESLFEDGRMPDYIMGNPPFVGTKWMNKEQKSDTDYVLKGWKNYGVLDYVACWYKKAADLAVRYNIRCALGSTNSICQGEPVAVLWQPMAELGISIDFAYRTFRWDSESSNKAHVHCIIVAFSSCCNKTKKFLYEDETKKQVHSINGYLVAADSIYVENRKTPIMDVPTMYLGCDFKDDGNFVMTEEEKDAFLIAEPSAEKFIRPYMMGKDFINRKPRYCLWLKNANPSELKACSKVRERIQLVQQFRLSCPSPDTRRYAQTPTLPVRLCFYNTGIESACVALPKVSSENRRYIPMELLSPEVIAGCKLFLVPNATNYDFGVLTSSAHMSWMRAVCGRLEMRYSYSANLVYNNFPWPSPTDEQKQKIEQTAQAILDARALYPDSSLADLYDDLTMPIELRKAHQANDRAVLAAYGFPKDISESDIVARLLEMYQELTK